MRGPPAEAVGRPRPAPPVKLVLGVLAARPELLGEVRVVAEKEFGRIELESRVAPWRATRYYEEELGPEPYRQFFVFSDPVDPADLAELKLRTNELEGIWSVGGRRRVNLDPGYLDLARLVLASTKDAAHRVYLGKGIYAEVTLVFADGRFRPFPHTYPDYASPEVRAFFETAREAWKRQRRERAR
ncbi:MAG: hypothetical protein KatS3mg076_1694 [Candidatus Binatia bacterium]|nr:MAG: hypothetical protein KatS3mg076_1694 [Candidatus Binatia bacterium]